MCEYCGYENVDCGYDDDPSLPPENCNHEETEQRDGSDGILWEQCVLCGEDIRMIGQFGIMFLLKELPVKPKKNITRKKLKKTIK